MLRNMGKIGEYFGAAQEDFVYGENEQHATGTGTPTPTALFFLLSVLYSHFICLKLWTMEQIFVHI